MLEVLINTSEALELARAYQRNPTALSEPPPVALWVAIQEIDGLLVELIKRVENLEREYQRP